MLVFPNILQMFPNCFENLGFIKKNNIDLFSNCFQIGKTFLQLFIIYVIFYKRGYKYYFENNKNIWSFRNN